MESIKINLVPSDFSMPVCHATQYDDGREIMLELFDEKTPYFLSDETIELDVKKLDGNVVTTELDVVPGERSVIMKTTEQMCAVAGRNLCTLKVQKDGTTIYTKNFYLSVQDNATEGGIESESEINNLETQIAGLVEDAVENQYDSENVIFDSEPTEGHGTGYTVTSAGIKAAIDAAGGNVIDDTTSSANKTYSSNKINEIANTKASALTVSNINNLEYDSEKVYVDDLTLGRINSSGGIDSVTYCAYSPTMRDSGETWYFDTTKFRLLIAQYSTPDGTPSIGGWITTSPYTIPTTRPYYKLMVSRLTSSGDIDINEAEATTYQKFDESSKLIDSVNLSNNLNKIFYVSSASGNDNNVGDSEHPFATIKKAIDSGASKVLVESGTYTETLNILNKEYPIKIALWDNDGTGKIKLTRNHVTGSYGIRCVNCFDVELSDIWVDDVAQGCFIATDVKKIIFNRCIASNNTTSEFMGFAISGQTNAFFYDCEAYNITKDGFNFHGSGNSLMQNCVAHDCADDGVSHHDSCTGSIVGGEFYNCGKGGVASPCYGANINIYDVYSHDNHYGLFAEGQAGRLVKGVVSGCTFLNNSVADIYTNYGDIIAWNNIYDTLSDPNNAYTDKTDTYTKAQVDGKVAGLIDDTTASDSKVYSSNKVDSLVGGVQSEISTKLDKGTSIEDYTFVEGTDVEQLSNDIKTSGKWIKGDGTEASSSAWDYYTLSVSAGEVYKVKTYCSGSAYGVVQVDGNGNATSHNADITTTDYTSVVIDENAVTMYVNNNHNEFANPSVLKKSADKYEKVVSDIEIERYTKKEKLVDIIGSATKVSGKYINSQGEIKNSSAWSYYELSVVGGDKYYINVYAESSIDSVVEYDSNGDFIKTTDLTNNVLTAFVPSSNAVLIRCNNKPSEQPYPEFYHQDGIWYENTGDRLHGKKLVVCGDSITAGTNPQGGYFANYGEIVANWHNMRYFRNARSGSTMANISGREPFCVDRYQQIPTDFDYLTIWFGWNDASYAQLGTIDSTDDTTFYGGYNKVLTYYLSTYPTKKIGLIVPYGNFPTYQQAVRDLSEKYGVPCLDLPDSKKCSLLWGNANASQEARRSALTYDNTHPNQDGYNFLATMFEQFILSL